MKIDALPLMIKKLAFAIITLFLMSAQYKGQRHEIGVQLGMSTLVGDIGRTEYIQKPVLSNIKDYGIPIYAALLYRMNFNPYQTVRLSLGYSNVQFIDALAKEYYRRNRNLWGTNSVYEANVLFEYNFFPVNDEQKSLLSPYIFGGLGGMMVNTPQMVIENDFKRDAGGNAIAPVNSTDFTTTPSYNSSGKAFTLSIPFGIGLKYKFNYNWAFFGELMFRPTFSDSLDYSMIDSKNIKETYNKDIVSSGSTKSLLLESPYKEIAEARAAEIVKARQIGNINSKDWVNTVSVGLSYSFGRPPCYCD